MEVSEQNWGMLTLRTATTSDEPSCPSGGALIGAHEARRGELVGVFAVCRIDCVRAARILPRVQCTSDEQ